jgi:hypothetical protein
LSAALASAGALAAWQTLERSGLCAASVLLLILAGLLTLDGIMVLIACSVPPAAQNANTRHALPTRPRKCRRTAPTCS